MNPQLSQELNYTIFIADHQPENLRFLEKILAQQGYQVISAQNSEQALKRAYQTQPNLILLDTKMSDISGYEVYQKLKADRATNSIPVIFIGEHDQIQDKVKAFIAGGVDFISKPLQAEEILASVQNQVALQAANEQIKFLQEQLDPQVRERILQIESANRILKDKIEQHHQLEQKLLYDALHDSLTGLPNRSLLMQQLNKCVHHVSEYPEPQFALLFVDLDRFKIINDSLGHLAGDELLIACAQRLSSCLNENTILARLGGDEFTILLEQVSQLNQATAIAEKILQEFAHPFNLGTRKLIITVSIGIVIGNNEYTQAIDLLRDADTALYRARELGKARYEVFTQQMYLEAIHRLEIENALREAIANQDLIVYYQPIMSLNNRQLAGFEALVRWHHSEQGIISPEQFIPLAEETSLIISLGQWVMQEACNQLRIWQGQFPQAKSLTMSINVAGEQLRDRNFLSIIDSIIAQTQVNPECLKLEITESMLIEDTKQLIEVLQQIKNRQIKLSLDDFGTGYSSLSYLPQFPLDILKIDRSFVEAMNLEQQNLEIIKTIIILAQVLGMQIIAEGIATEIQAQMLHDFKVEFGQGFFFSQPLTKEEAQSIINDL